MQLSLPVLVEAFFSSRNAADFLFDLTFCSPPDGFDCLAADLNPKSCSALRH